jgi:peptidoglycan hydrolase-like protein with peptidoglycan-binding domain
VKRRVLGILLSVAVIGGVGTLGYWAGTNAVVPPSLPLASHDPITFKVATGTVGSSVKISIGASWSTARTLRAGRRGTVTSVPLSGGAEVAEGSVVATIDLQPVVIAIGSVPMFRTLQDKVDGPDVAQFQRLLTAKGFYKGPIDGRFRATTRTATKLWQRSIGASQTGAVDAGALLFVESLPVRIAVIPKVGDLVGQSADLARILGAKPEFVALISAEQRANVRSGQPIAIAAPGGGTWTGKMGTLELQTDGRGGFKSNLEGALCDSDCALVPVTGETALAGTIELVPRTSGPLVPTSALVLQPSGGSIVNMGDGSTCQVTIVAEANGFAVVKGIEAGTVIRLPSPPGS